jgi:hypothetical protein
VWLPLPAGAAKQRPSCASRRRSDAVPACLPRRFHH